jgi:hypothetical protein
MIPPSTISFNRCGNCGELIYNTTVHNCAYVESGPTSQPQPAQEWTTTPQQPGWYWCWKPNWDSPYVCQLIYSTGWVSRGIKPGDLVMDGDQGEYPIDDDGSYWLGPIPEPEPPTS